MLDYGKTQDVGTKTGTVPLDGGSRHLPGNTSDKPFEAILVELKSKATTAK
jgi:hypothetical protein